MKKIEIDSTKVIVTTEKVVTKVITELTTDQQAKVTAFNTLGTNRILTGQTLNQSTLFIEGMYLDFEKIAYQINPAPTTPPTPSNIQPIGKIVFVGSLNNEELAIYNDFKSMCLNFTN